MSRINEYMILFLSIYIFESIACIDKNIYDYKHDIYPIKPKLNITGDKLAMCILFIAYLVSYMINIKRYKKWSK